MHMHTTHNIFYEYLFIVLGCGELCGSCDQNNSVDCLTCRYLRKVDEHDHNSECVNSSFCQMFRFTATEYGCGEFVFSLNPSLFLIIQ